jgi:CoA:oxalate CoA-transferase
MSVNASIPEQEDLPLDGILVVDLSQFLAGPLAGLKLADMGASVIKIERPDVGDLTRYLYLSDTDVDGVNTLFHAINRNKQSFAADLKLAEDLERVRKLISKADVVIQNFRPGVVERLGLDYESIREINPKVVYASISGYGTAEEWNKLPGQDLLAQAKSGLMWLTGDADHPPVPMGLAVADVLAGNNALQGILSGLLRSRIKNKGAHIEVSLLESILDLQFEVLTTYLNDGEKPPCRSDVNNGHAYLSAPYGVYETSDGYIAIAMTPVDHLGKLLGSEELLNFTKKNEWFTHRDEIKAILAKLIKTQPTSHWMEILVASDIWASEVFDWPKLLNSKAFKQLDFLQDLLLPSGKTIRTTRCPVRIDGHTLKSNTPAPLIGEHTVQLGQKYDL